MIFAKEYMILTISIVHREDVVDFIVIIYSLYFFPNLCIELENSDINNSVDLGITYRYLFIV